MAAEHLGATITYGELDRYADALAARLTREGVRPGDHVGLFVRRSIPMLVGLLGILKAGAAYVPQDIALAPPAQLAHVVRAARTTVVLTLREHAHRVPRPPGHRLIALDEPLRNVPAPRRPTEPRAPRPAVRPDDGCYVLFTSGTTGRPNGVKVTHRNVANILLTEPGGLGIRPGDRVAQLLNIAFDMAAWEILGCLAHGGTLVIRGKDIAATARSATVLIATPTVLSGVDPASCPRVRTVAVAGEPCPRPLADRWARRAAFFNCCGPTETTIVNTMSRHDPAAPLLTIGRPTPNNTVYVLDADRRPLPVGEVGEMWAGGDCVSAGYLGDDRLNAERYAPDPFCGGDHRMFRTRDPPDADLDRPTAPSSRLGDPPPVPESPRAARGGDRTTTRPFAARRTSPGRGPPRGDCRRPCPRGSRRSSASRRSAARRDPGHRRHPAPDPADRPGQGDGPGAHRPHAGRPGGGAGPNWSPGSCPTRGPCPGPWKPPRRSPRTAVRRSGRPATASTAPWRPGCATASGYERRVFHALFATEDQKEGMGAFLEKRAPRFTGR
ncbi:D-alanine--D-alanyl carrier protein ligase [Streptomyces alboniger]